MVRATLAAAAVLSALALGACGDVTPADDANISTAPAGEDYAARIRALNDNARNAVFSRAIRDGDQDCFTVTEAREVEQRDGAPAWLATCEGGGQWVVVLGPGGSATVTSAADVQDAGGR